MTIKFLVKFSFKFELQYLFVYITGKEDDISGVESQLVAGPSHDDIYTVTFQSDDIIKYKLLTEQQKIAKGFSFPQWQFGIKPSGKST